MAFEPEHGPWPELTNGSMTLASVSVSATVLLATTKCTTRDSRYRPIDPRRNMKLQTYRSGAGIIRPALGVVRFF